MNTNTMIVNMLSALKVLADLLDNIDLDNISDEELIFD